MNLIIDPYYINKRLYRTVRGDRPINCYTHNISPRDIILILRGLGDKRTDTQLLHISKLTYRSNHKVHKSFSIVNDICKMIPCYLNNN